MKGQRLNEHPHIRLRVESMCEKKQRRNFGWCSHHHAGTAKREKNT